MLFHPLTTGTELIHLEHVLGPVWLDPEQVRVLFRFEQALVS
jgi:hypothetical protein